MKEKRTIIIVQIVIVALLLLYSLCVSVLLGIASFNAEKWNDLCLKRRKFENKITNTVDIIVPKDFIEILGDDFNYTLTDEQKEKGFTKITKNVYGDAVFTISNSSYKIFKDEIKENTKQCLNDQIESLNGTGTSIHSVKYSSDLGNIKFYVDEEKYSYTFDNMNIPLFALTAYTYQIYDIDSNKTVKIEIINEKTGSTIEKYNYPENHKLKN